MKRHKDPDVYGLRAITKASLAMTPRGRIAAINWIIAVQNEDGFKTQPAIDETATAVTAPATEAPA